MPLGNVWRPGQLPFILTIPQMQTQQTPSRTFQVKYVFGWDVEHHKAWRAEDGDPKRKEMSCNVQAGPNNHVLASWPDGTSKEVTQCTNEEWEIYQKTEATAKRGRSINGSAKMGTDPSTVPNVSLEPQIPTA